MPGSLPAREHAGAVDGGAADAHAGPHQLWVAPGAEHVGAILHPDYWRVVLAFLDAAGV